MTSTRDAHLTARRSVRPAANQIGRPAVSGATIVAAGPAPAYVQVRQALKDGLARGHWPVGAQMPSEAELVARFGVSRMTVNRALRELQAEGLITRTQGVGTFAAPPGRAVATLRLQDIRDEIEARGGVHRAQVRLQRREKAPAAIAGRLGLRTGTLVFHTVIVHHENGVPLQCEDRYVNPGCVPDYLEADFTRVTPTQLLFERTTLWRARYAIEAAPPNAREAKWLGVPTTSPCLIVTRSTHTRDTTITVARLVHPGARFMLQGEFER